MVTVLLAVLAMQGDVSFEEKLLATLPGDGPHIPASIRFSPNGRRVAYVVQGGLVVGEQRLGKAYEAVGIPRFSADSSRVAFIASLKDSLQCVVIGGKEGKSYRGVTDLDSSPYGNLFAYRVQTPEGWRMVIDDRESEPSATVTQPVFSPDGKTVAYIQAGEDKEWAVIADRKTETFDRVWDITFSADGKRSAYSTKTGKAARIHLDGVAQEAFEQVIRGSFSPDGTTFTYAGKKEGAWWIVSNGKSRKFTEEPLCSAVFGPTGEPLAWSTEKWENLHIVRWNNQVSAAYNNASLLQLSADGTRLVFSTLKGKIVDGSYRVVVDMKEEEPFGVVGPVELSPDGRHWAYPAKKGRLLDNGPWYLVVDGKKHGPFNYVYPPVFDSDGRKVAAGVIANQRELWWKVISCP